MTSSFVLLSILLTLPAVAALKVPTAAQLRSIQSEIDAGRQIHRDEVSLLRKRARGFEQSMGLVDQWGNRIPTAPLFEQALNHLAEDQRVKYLAVLQELISRKKAMATHLNSAIRLSLVAYGISNPKAPPTGQIRSGFPTPDPFDPDLLPSYLGQTSIWEPRYGDELGEGKNVYGSTEHYGTSIIGLDAFTYPGKLAATLYHESLHFRELLTPGVDISNTPASEVRVREQVGKYERTLFRLSEADLAEHDATLRNYRESIEPWQLLLKDGFDPQRRSHLSAFNSSLRGDAHFPGAPNRASGHDMALLTILERADILTNRIARDVNDRNRREVAEREERQRVEDGQRLWESLAAFSRRICQAATDGRVPESMYPEWLEWRNGNYLAFSRDMPIVDMTILPGSVECAAFFENQILVARRSGYNHDVLTFEWAAEIVREAYRRSHPSVPTLPTPPTTPPVPPQVEPPAYPDLGGDVPAPPAIPHCRFHPWCQERRIP